MLKIWIPASKDERNCGLAQGLPINSGVTFTSGGYYGSYANFSSGNQYIKIPIDGLTGMTTSCTVCFWVKVDSWNAQWQTIFAFLKDGTPWTGNVFTFIRNNQTSAFTFSVSNGSQSTQTALLSNNINLNTWYHFACVYKTGLMSLYQDGVLIRTYSTSVVPCFSQITHAALGVECNPSFTSIAYQHRGGISDFRVYDHELHDWEIKKIYNTKTFEMEGGLHLEAATNIAGSLTPIPNRGGWGALQATKIDNGSYHIKHDYSSTGLSYWSTFVYVMPEEYANKTLTFSANIKNIQYSNLNANTSWIFIGQGNDGQYPTHGTVTHYYKDMYNGMQIKWTGQLTNSNRYLVIELWNNDTDNSGYIEFDLYNIQIEEGDKATPYTYESRTAWSTDSSCYKIASQPFNIIKSGSSINFNGTDSAINIPIAETITGGTWSINIWFYRPNGEWGTKTWETLIGGPSGFELSSKSYTTNSPQIMTYSWTNSGYTYECDKWNMVTLTRTPSGSKCYINGVLKHNGTAGAVPNNNYFLGAWNTATQQNFRGYIRSASVYKRELTQEDITNLYIHNE